MHTVWTTDLVSVCSGAHGCRGYGLFRAHHSANDTSLRALLWWPETWMTRAVSAQLESVWRLWETGVGWAVAYVAVLCSMAHVVQDSLWLCLSINNTSLACLPVKLKSSPRLVSPPAVRRSLLVSTSVTSAWSECFCRSHRIILGIINNEQYHNFSHVQSSIPNQVIIIMLHSSPKNETGHLFIFFRFTIH